MIKKSYFILIFVAGASVIILALLFFSHWEEKVEKLFPREDLKEIPLVEAKGVEFTGWDEQGRKSWILKAKEAAQFPQRIHLKKVEITLFEKGKPASEGFADEVVVESSTSDFYLKGNVYIISYRDGAELKTDELEWDGSEKKLFTEGEITIKKGGLLIKGKGLIGSSDLSKVIIKNQVTTYIKEGGI